MMSPLLFEHFTNADEMEKYSNEIRTHTMNSFLQSNSTVLKERHAHPLRRAL